MNEFIPRDYDDWLEYTFRRDSCWTHSLIDTKVNIDSRILTKWMSDCFWHPESLIVRYTEAQIDAGVWFIPSASGYAGVLLDRNVELQEREFVMRGLIPFFEGTYCRGIKGTGCYMWWDSFFSYCTYGGEIFDASAAIAGCVKSVIEEMILHKCGTIQKCGLHGKRHIEDLWDSIHAN